MTGASSGIGAAVACGLTTAGAAVGMNYRTHPEAVEVIVEDIVRSGGRALALRADVSIEDEVGAMFNAFSEALGRIDILVANSGIQKDTAASEAVS